MRFSNPARRWDYVLEIDRGDPTPTIFSLRRLTWEEHAQCNAASPLTAMQAMQLDAVLAPVREERRLPSREEIEQLVAIEPKWESLSAPLTRMHAKTCSFGLVEIRGLVDENGVPLSLTPAAFVEHAPAAMIQEVATEIIRLSTHGEDERKN